MSLLKVKDTVRPHNLWIAAAVINAAIVLKLRVDMLITAGTDGVHMKESKHYSGDALDIRTKHLSSSARANLLMEIRRRLGGDYDVVLESLGRRNEHAHIEYDPK